MSDHCTQPQRRVIAKVEAFQGEVEALNRLQAEGDTNEILKSRKLKAEMKLAVLDHAFKGES
jgi:hypothetical protein